MATRAGSSYYLTACDVEREIGVLESAFIEEVAVLDLLPVLIDEEA